VAHTSSPWAVMGCPSPLLVAVVVFFASSAKQASCVFVVGDNALSSMDTMTSGLDSLGQNPSYDYRQEEEQLQQEQHYKEPQRHKQPQYDQQKYLQEQEMIQERRRRQQELQRQMQQPQGQHGQEQGKQAAIHCNLLIKIVDHVRTPMYILTRFEVSLSLYTQS